MKTKPRRATHACIEALEARIAPATLDLSGGVLTFNAAAGIANNVSLSMTIFSSGPFTGQPAFVISSTGDSMTLSGGSGTLTGGGSSATAVAAVVSSIVINLGDGSDSMSVANAIGSGFSPLSINGEAGTDTVTYAGNVVVQSTLFSIAEVTNVNGAVIAAGAAHFLTDTMNLNTSTGQILGSTDVKIFPLTTNRAMTLGTEVAGTLSLTAAELLRISANGTLTLGENDIASSVNITAAVNLPSVGSLKLAAKTGGVTQAEFTSLKTTNLAVITDGSINLPEAGNSVSKFAAHSGSVTPSSVSFTNAGDLAIDLVAGIAGVFSNGRSIRIATEDGSITVRDTDGTSIPEIDAKTGTVSLQAGSPGGIARTITLDTKADIAGAGGVTLTADDMAINATIESDTSVTLQPHTAGRGISLNQLVAGTLHLTDAELDQVTTTRLFVGNATAGNITTADEISPAGTRILTLTTGAEIKNFAAPSPSTVGILVANLNLIAHGGIGVNSAIPLGPLTLAATTDTGGIQVASAFDLTIGDAGGTFTGMITDGADISVTTSGTISLASSIITFANIPLVKADVTLVANGASSDIVATVDGARVTTFGNISLTAGRDILLGTGGVDFQNSLIGDGVAALVAGRNVTVAGDTDVQSENISITTGADGLFTLADGADLNATGFGLQRGVLTLKVDRLSSIAIFDSGTQGSLFADTLVIRPVTPGRAVNLGSAVDTTANTLEISAAEIDVGFLARQIVIGGDDTGDVTFSAAITPRFGSVGADQNEIFEIRSGGTIANSFTGTAFTGALLRIASGTLAPGGNGFFTVASNFAFGPDATFAPTIGGTTPGTGFDQLAVTGAVDLGGAAFAPVLTAPLVSGSKFTLIDNDAADVITGSFAGLALGLVFENGGNEFLLVTTDSGTGNDLVAKALVPVAPTISKDGKTATYLDPDGDKVTVKTTKGAFTAANFTFLPTNETGLQQLRLLDLTTGADFTGAAITITAKKLTAFSDARADVGYIDATGKALGAVSLAGDLGQFDAASAKSLTVRSLGALGLDTQGASGSLQSNIGSTLGRLTVKAGFASAKVEAAAIGRVSIGGDYSGTLNTLTGGIGATVVKGDLLGGIFSAAAIAKVTVGGDLDGGGVNAVGSIGAITVGGTLQQGGIRSGASIGDVKVNGDLIDTTISAFGQAIVPTKGKDLAIKSLTIGGDVEDTSLLAGYSRTGVGQNLDASIGAILVKGSWARSSVLAGVEVGPDGLVGTADDLKIVGGPRDNPNLVSQIASITIRGSASGSGDNAADNFGIVAEHIVKAQIGTKKLALTKGPRSATDLFAAGTTGPGADGDATDFIIREITA